MIDPVMGTLFFMLAVGLAYWHGLGMGRIRGGHAEWEKNHAMLNDVAKTWQERWDAAMAERTRERKAGDSLVAANKALQATHAHQQRRLRGVLSEARRWKGIARVHGWVAPHAGGGRVGEVRDDGREGRVNERRAADVPVGEVRKWR